MISLSKRDALVYTLSFLAGVSHAEAGQAVELGGWLPSMAKAWLGRKKSRKPKSTRSSE